LSKGKIQLNKVTIGNRVMHVLQVLQGARLSFEWLQFRILSRNLKVRSTLYDSKFACEIKGTGSWLGAYALIKLLFFRFISNSID